MIVALRISQQFKTELKEKIAEFKLSGAPIRQVSQYNIIIQHMVIELHKAGISYKINKLGAGVQEIFTV